MMVPSVPAKAIAPMFGVAGLAEPMAAVVEAMAVFLFKTLGPREAGRLPGISAVDGGRHTVRRQYRMFHAIQLFGANVAY
jgi:hypothetical protein